MSEQTSDLSTRSCTSGSALQLTLLCRFPALQSAIYHSINMNAVAQTVAPIRAARASFAGKSVKAVAPKRSGALRASVLTQATARVDKCDKNSIIVSPSILSANFARLGEQVSFSAEPKSQGVPAGCGGRASAPRPAVRVTGRLCLFAALTVCTAAGTVLSQSSVTCDPLWRSSQLRAPAGQGRR